MLNSVNATKAECDEQAKTLLDLLKVKANILSVGKHYEIPNPYIYVEVVEE